MFVQHFGNNVTRGKAKANAKAKTKTSSNQNRDVLVAVALANPHVRIRWQVALLRCCPVAASLPDKAALAAWLTSALNGGETSVCVGVTNVKHYSSTVNTGYKGMLVKTKPKAVFTYCAHCIHT